jgi:hypothetical protein
VPIRYSILLFFALALASAAQAQTPTPTPAPTPSSEDQYQHALDLYEHGDYAPAADALKKLLYPPGKLFDPEKIRRAHLYCGISLFLSGDAPGADGEFYQVLLADPDFRPDPLFTPPPVIAEFDKLRAAHADELKKLPRTGRDHGIEPRDPLGIPVTGHGFALGRDFWISMAPFGIAQLHNKQPVKAWVLLGAESALVTADVSSYASFQALKSNGFTSKNSGQARTLKVVNNVSFGMLAAALLYGSADGLYFSANRPATRTTPVIQPAVGPGTAGVRMYWRF